MRWVEGLTSGSGSSQVLEAQMKEDIADKEMLESKRAEQEEEAREKSKLLGEHKAVRHLPQTTFYLSINLYLYSIG